jgi:hypothetical protein
MNEQEIRAWSLSIAVNLLGSIPESSSVNFRSTYEPYILMADRIAVYIQEGRLTKIQDQ